MLRSRQDERCFLFCGRAFVCFGGAFRFALLLFVCAGLGFRREPLAFSQSFFGARVGSGLGASGGREGARATGAADRHRAVFVEVVKQAIV